MCRCVSAVEFQDHKRRTSSGNSNAQVVTSGANVLWSCYLSWKSAAQRAEPPRKRCWNEQCVVAFQTSQPISSQLRSVKTCGNLNNIKQLEFLAENLAEKDPTMIVATKFPFSEAIRMTRPCCDAQLGDLVASPNGLPGAPRARRGGSWRAMLWIYMVTFTGVCSA